MGYQSERFEELVLYIASRTRDDPDFGRTKLAKVLFYSDFEAFEKQGRPLTGATYEKQPYGPFPRELVTAELDLSYSERAHVPHAEALPNDDAPNKLLPRQEPNLNPFDKWELALVDKWIERLRAATAVEVSRLTHEHPGWAVAAMGEEIPYHTVFLSRRKPPDEAIAHGMQLIREYGWEPERP